MRSWIPIGLFLSVLAIGSQANGGVPYVTGGIGAEEIEALGRASARHDLKLVFAFEGHGAYAAEVSVRILDQRGREVLAADDAGPLLFTTLASGTYRVDATLNGWTLSRVVAVVEGRQARLAFYWPRALDRPGAVAEAQPAIVAARAPASPPAIHEVQPMRRVGAPSSDRLAVRIERVWSDRGSTYATIGVRNTAAFSLVKASVDCKTFGRDGAALGEGREAIVSPGDSPFLPGTVRTATVPLGTGEVRSASCEARAL